MYRLQHSAQTWTCAPPTVERYSFAACGAGRNGVTSISSKCCGGDELDSICGLQCMVACSCVLLGPEAVVRRRRCSSSWRRWSDCIWSVTHHVRRRSAPRRAASPYISENIEFSCRGLLIRDILSHLQVYDRFLCFEFLT